MKTLPIYDHALVEETIGIPIPKEDVEEVIFKTSFDVMEYLDNELEEYQEIDYGRLILCDDQVHNVAVFLDEEHVIKTAHHHQRGKFVIEFFTSKPQPTKWKGSPLSVVRD